MGWACAAVYSGGGGEWGALWQAVSRMPVSNTLKPAMPLFFFMAKSVESGKLDGELSHDGESGDGPKPGVRVVDPDLLPSRIRLTYAVSPDDTCQIRVIES